MRKFETAVFGEGCFWCVEAIFESLKGVKSVKSGYAGGSMPNPSYHTVSEGTTGHAEVVKIEFDPTIIQYKDLLDIFWNTHNPTIVNRQGFDKGTQYRSIILYTSDEQKKEAKASRDQLNKSGQYKIPVATEIKPLDKFYGAEEYHQNYYEEHINEPYCQLVISPKLLHLREKYAKKLK